VLLGASRTVQAASPAPSGITVTELLKTEPRARRMENFVPGKTDLRAALASSKEGAYPIITLAEKKIGEGDTAKTARLIVVGESNWISDQLVEPLPTNMGLASGLIGYLGEEEALISIPPKEENTEEVFLMPDQSRLLQLIHLADFPLLALILAIGVYLKRR
jgi:hypothetical protein